MRILLDVDGPCADLVGHLLAHLYDDLPHRMHRLIPEYDQIKQFNLKSLVHEDVWIHITKIFQSEAFWATLPVADFAGAYVPDLMTNHDVVFVTSPWGSCKGWGYARCFWLDRNFGVKPENIICAHRKELVRGDVIIDDKAENVIQWVEANEGRGFIQEEPWNSNPPIPQPLVSRIHRLAWPAIFDYITTGLQRRHP